MSTMANANPSRPGSLLLRARPPGTVDHEFRAVRDVLQKGVSRSQHAHFHARQIEETIRPVDPGDQYRQGEPNEFTTLPEIARKPRASAIAVSALLE